MTRWDWKIGSLTPTLGPDLAVFGKPDLGLLLAANKGAVDSNSRAIAFIEFPFRASRHKIIIPLTIPGPVQNLCEAKHTRTMAFQGRREKFLSRINATAHERAKLLLSRIMAKCDEGFLCEVCGEETGGRSSC